MMTVNMMFPTRAETAFAASEPIGARSTAPSAVNSAARRSTLLRRILANVPDADPEGTETIQSLLIGRDLTGLGAFR